MNKEEQICSKCVMDTTDPLIIFNDEGVCNHCLEYDEKIKSINQNTFELDSVIERVKSEGKGRKYDCIIGLSGGVDSTYVAHLVKDLKLRPLAIHLDNGWNSETAVMNVKNTVEKLNIDLITYVINWEEFADIQRSFFLSGTPDVEVPSDHAIFSILRKYAKKFKVKYVINGINFKTESHHVLSWSQGHSDWKYIKSVHKKFGKKKIKTFPHGNIFTILSDRISNNWINILDYVDYNKDDAKKLIIEKLDWKDYGGKHFESIFTRFYQGYYLKEKFNYDKRKMHLSSLICGNLISREDSLKILKEPSYDPEIQKRDLKFVQKKLRLNKQDWDNIMSTALKSYYDYDSYYGKILKSSYYSLIKKIISKII
jgi:N-acetyl sugar amidotransferase